MPWYEAIKNAVQRAALYWRARYVWWRIGLLTRQHRRR